MKFVADRSFADPEVAARKLMEIANAVEPVQDGRIHREDQLAVPVRVQGQPGRIRRRPQARDRARLALESGTYVKITSAGAELTWGVCS
jgi:hypothetical protein